MDREEAETLALKQVEAKGIHHKGVSCSVFLHRGESFGDFPVADTEMWLVDFIPTDTEGPWVLTIPVKATSKRPKLKKLTTQWFDFYKKKWGISRNLSESCLHTKMATSKMGMLIIGACT